MRISKFAGGVLAAVIAIAAASAAAQQDEGPVLKPKSKPRPSSTTILAVCDLDCTWTLDGEAMGSLAAGKFKKVPVSLGQHLLDAVTSDRSDNLEREIELKTATQTIVRFELKPLRDARLKSEQEAREKVAGDRASPVVSLANCDVRSPGWAVTPPAGVRGKENLVFEGDVFNEDTMLPIVGAYVSVCGILTISDDSGAYRVEVSADSEPTRYDLMATKEGFQFCKLTVSPGLFTRLLMHPRP